LEVSAPSHCVLLQSVADELTSRIAKIEIKTPKAIYVSNRRARVLRDPDGIREDLATNIAYPVRWHDATTVAYERGVRFFLELPPGHTLTDLASTAFPDARSIALSQMQIDSAVKLIKRQAEKMRQATRNQRRRNNREWTPINANLKTRQPRMNSDEHR
jgi:malonate decarboxylase epsilon subunit